MNEMKPCSIAVAPSDGPITLFDTTSTFADILPDFNTLARSLASSGVKLPVICELPPSMRVLTRGAEYTLPSSTIAIARPRLLPVMLAHWCEPLSLIRMLTTLPCMLSYSVEADVITSPSSTGSPLSAMSDQ